ncbi:MAG: c-type cytochrome [Myxococcales bacterium FL481]|nr:MAG: c-type cytochrome [Myxococcales bacterium FL481]
MSNVTDKVLDHDYDGIKEYDNPLPRWWVWMFYATIAFALVYFPIYHWGPGDLPTQAYEKDMEAWNELHPPAQFKSEKELRSLFADSGTLEQGKALFTVRCAPCHAPDGGGLVGPNLTDDFSIHGHSRVKIVEVIHDGVPDKGMVPWGPQMSIDEIYQVAAYARSLRGQSAATPKPPQGDPITDKD